MSNKSTDKYLKFRKALQKLFKGTDGKEVMEFLNEHYVEIPAIDQTPELTYYRLGQKEFVQSLIKDATTDLTELENLTKGG